MAKRSRDRKRLELARPSADTSASALKEKITRAGVDLEVIPLKKAVRRMKQQHDYWKELGDSIRRSGKRIPHAEIAEGIRRLEQET